MTKTEGEETIKDGIEKKAAEEGHLDLHMAIIEHPMEIVIDLHREIIDHRLAVGTEHLTAIAIELHREITERHTVIEEHHLRAIKPHMVGIIKKVVTENGRITEEEKATGNFIQMIVVEEIIAPKKEIK